MKNSTLIAILSANLALVLLTLGFLYFNQADDDPTSPAATPQAQVIPAEGNPQEVPPAYRKLAVLMLDNDVDSNFLGLGVAMAATEKGLVSKTQENVQAAAATYAETLRASKHRFIPVVATSMQQTLNADPVFANGVDSLLAMHQDTGGSLMQLMAMAKNEAFIEGLIRQVGRDIFQALEK